jgi:hypothetical protein
MSRFDQEWAIVPQAARWIAVFIGLVVTASIGWIWLVPVVVDRDFKSLLVLSPFLVLALFAGAVAAVFVCFVGYVFADAKRRGMNHVVWTLIAIFVPNAIGIILYFILRDPIALPCPACGTRTQKGHAYCPDCGTPVRPACPSCRQPVEPAWRVCPRCGTPLTAGAVASAAGSAPAGGPAAPPAPGVPRP